MRCINIRYCCRRKQLLSSARGTQQHNSRQVADQREAASLQRYNCGCIEGLDQTGNSCSNKACHTNSEFPDLINVCGCYCIPCLIAPSECYVNDRLGCMHVVESGDTSCKLQSTAHF